MSGSGRRRTRAAEPCPAAGQEADGCCGLGARRPPRRLGNGVMTKPRQAAPPTARPGRAARRSTSCGRSRNATPTPTSCCQRCCANAASPAATPPSPPNWPTAPAVPADCSTPSSPHAAGRPPDRINPVLLDLLRLGTYQLLRTRVDAHAAVSTTVEQAGIEFDSARAGFVNGVLRTISARDEQSWIDELAPSAAIRPGRSHRRSCTPIRAGSRQAFADALGAEAGELDALLTGRRRAAAGASGRPARGADGR